MGDSTIKTAETTPPAQPPDITSKLAADSTSASSSGSVLSKLGRVGEVTVDGIVDTPAGIVHSLEDFAKPENWGKDALMIGTSAAFGAVMRIALPESGALTTAAGLIMGGMFLKDGAMPMVNAWGSVWNDGSSQTMSNAAQTMGDGLGNFAVQGGISVAAAGLAAKMTPDLMTKVAPNTWSGIESWKAANLGSASPFGLAVSGSLSGIADRFGFSKAGTSPDMTTAAAQPADATVADAARPSIKDLSSDQVRSILANSQTAESTRIAGSKLARFGIQGSDGNFHSYDDAINLLMEGKDPGTEPAGTIQTARSLPLSSADLSKPDSLILPDQSAIARIPTEDADDVAARRQPGGRTGRPKAPTDKGTPVTPTDTTAGAAGSGKVTDASRILNAKTMTAQAAGIKANIGMISDQDGLIMDAMNRNLGAIDVRTNPNVKPLLGYDAPRQAAFDLAQQVGTDPGSFMQVNDLYERFAAGALQSGTMDSSDIAAHVARMDQYAKENFTTYRNNIIQAGIDPDVALAQKPAPPLVEGTSDLERIGTDQDGQPVYSHEGPHTLRAIYGPKGEPVWPLDMVKSPIREIGMRGVNTSGIYGHEFMHDQFGHLAEFDPQVRDATLGDAAAKAWGKDANTMVDLPNGGTDPQKVLLDSVVRKMAKVDPADQDAFLADKLGLDAQSKVMRGAKAADTLLGPAGQSMVQVPGSGAMPLEVFVGNIAAMADDRTPTQVLAEMQGKGTPTATEAKISANVDKILGPNGQQIIPMADGSHLSLKDTVMKVSDETRNPQFDTYDKPLPAQMSNKDILVNVAKAWADETFADWGAAAESGQSAAPYFQALSKDGLLRTATVMGQDMRNPNNELGIEAHPTDTLRPRYQAALIRSLATAKGQHDQVLLDWADALENYSRQAAKPGPITLTSLDSPGQSLQIPQDVFDKFIPQLVDAQLNTPLPRLQGKTLFDILPDLRKNFRTNDGISDQWTSAIQGRKGPETLPFDAAHTKMTNVYGAGQLTFLKLVTGGMDPLKANDAVNQFSDFFGDKIVQDRASAPATPASAHKLSFASMGTGSGDSGLQAPFAIARPAGISSAAGADASAGAGAGADASTSPSVTGRIGQGAKWLARAATGPTGAAATSAYQISDLLGLHKVQQDVLSQSQ